MRRLLVLLVLALGLLPAFGGCGITMEGGLEVDGGGGVGADGGIGGTSVGGGTCFPGAKVCPDPKTGELVCSQSNEPATGCKASTACSPCIVPHAEAGCDSAGHCTVQTCHAGWDDCNKDPVDGCETDLTGDKNHCGSCTTDCITQKGNGWICKAGTCEVNECCPPPGDASCATKQDCDGNKQNGCEVDLATDPNNCKTCGNVCSLPHASSTCTQEICVVTACDAGWDNCDANDANGCETNIAGDSANCGACKKACNATNGQPACVGGACQIACNTGFANCNNNAADGCEINVTNDVNHCNGCGNKCNGTNGTPSCVTNTCQIACNGGFSNCNNNASDGCEINTQTDKNNCNGCGNACPVPANSTSVCTAGGCGFNCNSGFGKCGSTTTCYNLSNDPQHCGGTCTTCSGPTVGTGNAVCQSSACGISCTGSTPTRCGTGCYDGQNDKTHCGSSCASCPDPSNGSGFCSGGSCNFNCNSGYHKCGNQCRDNTSVNSCGSSCTACPGPTGGTGTTTCDGTNCGITCTGSTTTLCGTACVNINTNNNHCGGCNNPCTGGKTCQSGMCCPPASDAGANDGGC